MDFVTAIKTCFSKYADFSGRARRSEFWYWYLFSVIVSFVAGWIPFVGGLMNLALVIPQLSVGARRLHDTGRSGWWLLLSIVPGLVMVALAIALFGSAILSIASGEYNPDMVADNMMSNMGLLVAMIVAWLVTLVCGIILIVWWAKDSVPGANQYGENPKGM